MTVWCNRHVNGVWYIGISCESYLALKLVFDSRVLAWVLVSRVQASALALKGPVLGLRLGLEGPGLGLDHSNNTASVIEHLSGIYYLITSWIIIQHLIFPNTIIRNALSQHLRYCYSAGPPTGNVFAAFYNPL